MQVAYELRGHAMILTGSVDLLLSCTADRADATITCFLVQLVLDLGTFGNFNNL